MMAKKFLIFVMILLFAVYPASAAQVSLNKWALNVMLHEDGTVGVIIQTQIENTASLPLDGFSFVVPASKLTTPNVSTFYKNGQDVKLQTVSGGTKIIITYNTKLEPEDTWGGRIEFNAENWAVKQGMDYSIDIPVEAPMAIVSGKESRMSIPAEPEIRSQVFLPESVNPTSVEPSKPPYKKLLQFNKIVLTWFQLNIGDVIHIRASYSDDLNEIIKTNDRFKELSDQVKKAKAQGRDVSGIELHLSGARDYYNQAVEEFWKNKDVLTALDAANHEMDLAENSLSSLSTAEPEQTAGEQEVKDTPAAGALLSLISILFIIFLLKKKK